VAGVGADNFSVIQNDNGGGVAFRARWIGEFCPCSGGPTLNVVGNKNTAGRRADDAGVHAVRGRRVDCQPEDRVVEVVDRLPGSALIGRCDDLSIRVRGVQGAVGQAGTLVQVVDVRGGGVERIGAWVLNQTIHGIGVMAGVAERPGHAAVGAADSFDVRITSKQVRRVAPEHLPDRGVFNANAMVKTVGDGGRPCWMLVGGAHVGLLPRRTAVARAVNKTKVGDESFGRVIRCHGQPEDDLAVTPAAVAT